MSHENVITPTDAELLLQFAQHQDDAAFRVLVERHGPLVLGTCRQILRQEHDVDDAFQATFLVLALKARTINRTASIASWLYRVAFRTAMRAAKQRQRRQTESIREDAVVSDDPLVKIHEQSINKALHEELTSLPDSYRAPLVLCYLQHRSRQEAANELECTESSVKARLARGKRILRLKLARRGIGLSLAIGLVSQDVAEASAPLTTDIVARTVSVCSVAATKGVPPVSDCSHQVVTLAKQGMQTMIVPSIVKSTAAVFAVGVAVATFSINADDGASPSGRDVSDAAGVILPIAPDGTTSAEVATANAARTESSDNALVATISQIAPASPAPPAKPTDWVQVKPPRPVPATPKYQPNQPASLNDEQLKLEVRKLGNQRQYLLAKAKGYQMLAKAYESKGEPETSGEYSTFELMEARGQWLLNKAESERFNHEAEIIEETIKLLEKQNTAAAPIPPTAARGPNPNAGTTYPPYPAPGTTMRTRPPVDRAASLLRPGQQIKIHASGTMPDEPINGIFSIEPETGSVALGPSYGRVKIEGLELLEAEEAILHHLEEMLKSPKVQVTIPPGFGDNRYTPTEPYTSPRP